MKAMVLIENHPIETSPLKMVEIPDPHPGFGEIRIKVHYCAICRTDLHVIEGDLPNITLPIIPGHQVIGLIDELGSGCHRLEIGTRVGVAWLHSTCGECRFCHSGKENLCEESLYTGYNVNGGYAEYIIAKENYVYPIPDTLEDMKATPLLCAGIIGYRALLRSQLPNKGVLGIFGFGSSAHIVIQLALAAGSKIYVVTRANAHQELARKLGACWAGDSAQGIPEPLDSVILFAPTGALVPIALQSLNKGGTLAVAGIHLTEIPQLDYHRDLFFERDLRSVTANTRSDGYELFQAATRAHIHTHTQIYPLSDANRALQDLKQDRIRGTGVLRMPETAF